MTYISRCASLILISAIAIAATTACSTDGDRDNLSASTSAPSPHEPSAPAATQQNDLEQQADTLVEDARVTAAKEEVATLLRDSGLAVAPATQAKLEPYVDGLAFTQALRVVNQQQDPPIVGFVPYPKGRSGLDNPDNLYRSIAVDDQSSYLIRGKRNSSFDLYLQLMDGQPGDGSLSTTLGFMSGSNLKTDHDGSFTISLNPSPAHPDEPNHIQLQPNAKVLIIRDTLNDWEREKPADLSVEKIDGPPVPRLQDPAAEVARRVQAQGRFWLEYVKQLSAIPANSLTPPKAAVGGLPGQVNAFGRFTLQSDQALVITFPHMEWPYFGVQLADNWFRSIDYWENTSSLNTTQAVANGDGSVTYVVSTENPGVVNWLDPAGVSDGLILARWQGLPQDVVPRSPDVVLTETKHLPSLLGPGVAMATPHDRATQIASRRAAFDHRGLEPAP